jgi:predicted outer membrane repeat protein
MRKKKRTSLVIAVVLGVMTLSGLTFADELYVPGQYVTIQAAIDDANDGDVVVVADGDYAGDNNKNLDFVGRGITVRSLNGPEFTIIDCEGEGRGLYFHNGEDGNSVVSGFFITNGHVTNSSPGSDSGGAILCEDNSNPTIVNCSFISNSAPQRNGGAIDATLSSPVIRNCTFTQNQAGAHGGAASFGNSNALVDSCVFIGNHCDNFSADGGAIYIGGTPAPIIKNCLFIGNRGGRDGSGGAIRNYYASPTIINSTFVGNKTNSCCSSAIGGAIANVSDSSPIITNCILWGNSAPRGGNEIANSGNCHPVVSYCNIRGGWNGSNVYNRSGSSVINAGGNINADSLFASGPLGDYYLSQIIAGQSSDSPCVDAGSDLAINLSLANFTTRTDNMGDLGIVDIGYHYPAGTRIAIDIKPANCPNPLNLKSKGVFPTAILGSEDFDVSMIDIASIRLEDVAAIRSSYEDVASPVADGEECECTEDGPDGYVDLLLKFSSQEIVEELIDQPSELAKAQTLILTLTGELFDGTGIEGSDCVVLVGNVSKWLTAKRWDAQRRWHN